MVRPHPHHVTCQACSKRPHVLTYAGFTLCAQCLPRAVDAMVEWLCEHSCYDEIKTMQTVPAFSECRPGIE